MKRRKLCKNKIELNFIVGTTNAIFFLKHHEDEEIHSIMQLMRLWLRQVAFLIACDSLFYWATY